MAVCDNIRISRRHLYPRRRHLYPRRRHGEAFRGFIASKKRYFYGLWVHLVVTTSGLLVEVMLAPGACVCRPRCVCLPPQAHVFADAVYLDQHEEALLAEAGLHLVAPRRKNSKTLLPPWVSYIIRHERKRIETVFSQIASALGRTVHAVTPRGFKLRAFLAVLAYTLTATL